MFCIIDLAELMVWHSKHQSKDDIMRLFFDCEAFKAHRFHVANFQGRAAKCEVGHCVRWNQPVCKPIKPVVIMASRTN